MNKFGSLALTIALGVFAAACSPAPNLPSAPIPTLPPLPSLVAPATLTPPPTSTSVPTATTLAPTASPGSPSTGALTQTLTARATVTATVNVTTTRVATTTAPTLAPTSAVSGFPPGVYVTDLRIDPNPPTRTSDLTFYPIFANSFATVQNYRWRVFIYKQDNPSRSIGDTTPATSSLPVGSSEQKPGGTWKWGPGNQCDYFFIRVGSLDQDSKVTLFSRPDGKVFEKNLTLCP